MRMRLRGVLFFSGELSRFHPSESYNVIPYSLVIELA